MPAARRPNARGWSDLADFVTDCLLSPEGGRASLRAVLRRIAAAFGADCALVLHPATGQPIAPDATFPARAAADVALLAEINARCAMNGRPGRASALVHTRMGDRDDRPLTVALPGPVSGQRLCLLVLVGGLEDWPPDAALTLRSCATTIAARLRLDEDRSAREMLAAALIAASPDPIIAVDEAGQLSELNPAAAARYGVSWPAARGADAFTALDVPEQHRSMFREAIAAYLATGESSVFGSAVRLRGRLGDGSEPVVLFTAVPMKAADRTYFGVFVHDIVAPGEGTADAETDVRFGMLSELAPVGIVQADADGRCTFVNGRWCKLAGVSGAEALGRSWLSSVHPDDADRVRGKLAAVTASGGELRADFRLRSARGRQTWVHAAVKPIIGPDCACSGQLAAFTNVDERKRAETERERARRQLTEQNARLRDLDMAKTQFLGTVSHELRSPLTSIVSFTELLKDDQHLGSAAREYLDIIERNANRLLRLVSDLLYLTQLDEGGVTLVLAPVDVADVAAEAARSGAASAAEKGIEIHVSQDDGPAVQADRHRLQQVLDNLLSNAIKFTEPGGRIDVRARWIEPEWRLSVIDSGIGIPPDEIAQLFDRFFRASNAVSQQVPGTGLGLATAKALTELHGGSLEVSSKPGVGTTVTVRLPAGE